MPARRLFDSPRDEPGRLLVQVPDAALPTSKSWACGLAACLASALQVCSAPVQYAELMGLLNAAFMLRVDEQFSAAAVIEGRWHRLIDVLRQLGFDEAQLHEHGAAPELVAAELRAGRPLLALGWGEKGLDWSLVCGQCTGNDRWWGYQFAVKPTLIEWEPQCRKLLSLGPQTAQPDLYRARSEALANAAHLRASLHDPLPEYAKWAEMLRRDDLVPEGTAGNAMFRRHEWLVEALLDARAAAADFLQAIAKSAAAETELLTAADMYIRVVDMLESRDPLFYGDRGCDAFRVVEQRAEWAQLLAAAAQIEGRALILMSHATTGLG